MRDEEGIEEVLEKYRRAGRIVAEVRARAASMVREGVPILEVAEFVENAIRERGAEPAFPCNISLNEVAAHSTPSRDDKRVFGGELVKLDIGAHVEGYIADAAVTIDLSGENGRLVEAAEEALKAAISVIHDGVSTAEVGAAIEKVIREYGFKPIVNLSGHGLARYVAHAPPTIPNVGQRGGAVLRENDVVAIEPFATNGAGRVSEGATVEIYSLVREKPVRLPAARRLLAEIRKYKTLPFAKRWLPRENLDVALRNLEAAGVIRSYPVLREAARGLISQAEHTVIVKKDGCEVITA
ncbi:MAG: type II methionyl aminopeptidase [Candidatus Alkanophagales archaeon]